MTRNDVYWKGLIEDLFPYFIPFFLPRLEPMFDRSRPVEFLDKELQQLAIGNDAENRFVDKLVKIYTTDGKEKWVLIHIEVQGYHDQDFAQRMFTYFYRILDRYGVPVTAIAIYTDSNPSFHPSHYNYDFVGTEMNYRFNTYKVLAQQEAELKKSNNPFAIAILTVLLALRSKKLDDENLLNLKIDLARRMYAKGFPAKITRQLFNFIRQYVNFAKPETIIKFDRTIDTITQNNQSMGLEEQILEITRQKGIREGEEKATLKKNTFFVEQLLHSSDFTVAHIAFLAGVTPEFVQEIKAKLGL